MVFFVEYVYRNIEKDRLNKYIGVIFFLLFVLITYKSILFLTK